MKEEGETREGEEARRYVAFGKVVDICMSPMLLLLMMICPLV